jgi:hypothetical protein
MMRARGGRGLNPPRWNEADSFRETSLVCIDDPEDREALHRVGRLLYHLALLETNTETAESGTCLDLRAEAADLRYLEGHLARVGGTTEEICLAEEEALARFAGELAPRVGALAEAIERALAGTA